MSGHLAHDLDHLFDGEADAVAQVEDQLVALLQRLQRQPLALGGQAWQANGLFDTLTLSIGGKDLYQKVYGDKDAEAAAGPDMAKIFAAAVEARDIDDARATEQLEQARDELERLDRGESDADRWQLEQRVRHAENQLAVSGRG